MDEDDVWLPSGHYEIDVQRPGYEGGRFRIDVDGTEHMLVPISLKQKTETADVNVDMVEDAGSEVGQVQVAADPRPKKFKTLLATRYQRGPTPEPIPIETRAPTRGPWPYLAAGSSIAAFAAGLVLHSGDHTGAAFASYGTGTALAGLSTYLFLRSHESKASTVAIRVEQHTTLMIWRSSL